MLSLRNTVKGTWKIVASQWYRQALTSTLLKKIGLRAS
jgi:hypothetical protein